MTGLYFQILALLSARYAENELTKSEKPSYGSFDSPPSSPLAFKPSPAPFRGSRPPFPIDHESHESNLFSHEYAQQTEKLGIVEAHVA